MKNKMPRYTQIEFANIVELAKNKTFFCIEKCEKKQQTNGVEKWYLTIVYDKTPHQAAREWLTFFVHLKDGRVNRKNDALFTPMLDKENMPIHNAFITANAREYWNGKENVSTVNYELDWVEDTLDTCSCQDTDDDAA